MRIENLFKKDIFRPINGVIKADQLDESSVWQELEEFVVTQEMDSHLRKFFSGYSQALERGNDPEITGQIGIWVSGFFGSGKSHFIKVLSHLLDNQPHSHQGESKRAVEFFQNKIDDAMFLGDIQRAVASDTDVILFNIDSKADNRAGRDALLVVFLKVLNERQGFSGDHPHIAHMERYLQNKDKLKEFHDNFRQCSSSEWTAERDAYDFHRDEVIDALSQTLGQSKESCEKWIDNAEGNFSLTVENFAKWVKDYLDLRGSAHRLVFLADEVGQFIGSDTHLMLNLQTITEELGTVCKGRAWIVVTSQEDIDSVLGDMPRTKANDFSKIQGRFKTRLSLSSRNVDEVIQERLLSKREEVISELKSIFSSKGDVLKNQLSFKNVGMTLKPFQDGADFVKNYPFAPYQFILLQKIFESIRKAGATGLHLAQGERSLLDAFQSAAKEIANKEVGVLVPLYMFYSSIENFLDTSVKRTIDNSAEDSGLEPFDSLLLKVLFLIRYVEEIRGNVDNLVTLCLDQIDGDRLALRRKIEESLARLEKITLVSRSGENYLFLTNEERDVGREIKNVELSNGEQAKLLGDLIFNDVYREQRKHRYSVNKMDFQFNRICDLHPFGAKTDGALIVSVITPMVDDPHAASADNCLMDSDAEGGKLIIRLKDSDSLGRELSRYLKTDKYLRTGDDGTLPLSTKRVRQNLAEENRARRELLSSTVSDLISEASYFAAGQKIQPKGNSPLNALTEGLEYLISNTFKKMSYLRVIHSDENSILKEVQALLRTDDIAQYALKLNEADNNPQAIAELREYIDLCTRTSREIVLYDILNTRFAGRPYGWPPFETVLLLARLYAAGELQFKRGGGVVSREKVYETITTSLSWKQTSVIRKTTARPEDLRKARELGRELFSEMGPDAEESLYLSLHSKFKDWQAKLVEWKSLASMGSYPGEEEISESLALVKSLVVVEESNKFIERLLERREELLSLAADYRDLSHFYNHQKSTWETLHKKLNQFRQNITQLEQVEEAKLALQRMTDISSAKAPYGLLKEVDDLVRKVAVVNNSLVTEKIAEAMNVFARNFQEVVKELDLTQLNESLRVACLSPFDSIKRQIEQGESLAHIAQAKMQAEQVADAAHAKIAEAAKNKAEEKGGEKPKVKPRRVIQAGLLMSSAYLETKADINNYLDTLRNEMEDAIAKGERIQVR